MFVFFSCLPLTLLLLLLRLPIRCLHSQPHPIVRPYSSPRHKKNWFSLRLLCWIPRWPVRNMTTPGTEKELGPRQEHKGMEESTRRFFIVTQHAARRELTTTFTFDVPNNLHSLRLQQPCKKSEPNGRSHFFWIARFFCKVTLSVNGDKGSQGIGS